MIIFFFMIWVNPLHCSVCSPFTPLPPPHPWPPLSSLPNNSAPRLPTVPGSPFRQDARYVTLSHCGSSGRSSSFILSQGHTPSSDHTSQGHSGALTLSLWHKPRPTHSPGWEWHPRKLGHARHTSNESLPGPQDAAPQPDTAATPLVRMFVYLFIVNYLRTECLSSLV